MVPAIEEATRPATEPVAGTGGRDPDGPPGEPSVTLAELRDAVLAYFRQEAVDPLKRLGAWLGFGLLGAVLVSTGIALLALGGLRALQTETGDHLAGNLSWTPYAIVTAALMVVLLGARSAARSRRRGTGEESP